jgi:hypothetical protein
MLHTPEVRKDAWKDGLPPRVEGLRRSIATTIPCWPDTPDVRNDLTEKSIHSLMLLYITWVDRFIPPRPRKVQFSEAFWTGKAAQDHETAIKLIASKVEAGDSVVDHLSKRVHTHGYVRDNPKRKDGTFKKQWKHRDLQLAASDIHHLHIYPEDRAKDLLLFVKVERDILLFMGTGRHDDIRSGKVIEEGYRHKYSDGIFHALDVRSVFGSAENRELIQAGVSTMLVSQHGVHMGSAVTTSGDALHYRTHASELVRILYVSEECLRDDKFVDGLFENAQLEKPQHPEFHWHLNWGDLLLYEVYTGIYFEAFNGRR